jgi:ABC-type sugar transport system ATPase subunit
VKLDLSPDVLLRRLSIGQAQRVAIARALSMNARILLLDEPTSSLTEDGVESLFELIAHLKRQDVAVVYVSHKTDEVRRIADVITVLRDGRHVGTSRATKLGNDELIAMMVGRTLDRAARPKREIGRDVLLEVANLRTDFVGHKF